MTEYDLRPGKYDNHHNKNHEIPGILEKRNVFFYFSKMLVCVPESIRMLSKQTNESHVTKPHQYGAQGPVRSLRGASRAA